MSSLPRILSTPGYLMRFNLPAQVHDRVQWERPAPLQRVWSPFQAVGCYWPFSSCDVLHTMNQIPPYRFKPWVVTFESVLPRTLTGRQDWLFRRLRERLLSSDCLGIIAMSDWARRTFNFMHGDWVGLAAANDKLTVLHPSIVARSREVRRLRRDESLRIVFVGNNFARKGGVVALRMAKRALAARLPIELHIVSRMVYGPGCHTDHQCRDSYKNDIALLSLPNVLFHGSLSNNDVFSLMTTGHVTFLPTLHDTYGFSIIEGFSCGTPAITSNVCAQPEINGPDRGLMLSLPIDAKNCWTGLGKQNLAEYWEIVNAAYGSLADQAFVAVQQLYDAPQMIESMSEGAINAVRSRHDPEKCATVLQQIYARKSRT